MKTRPTVITPLMLVVICSTALAAAISAQEVPQTSPTPRPTLSPTISPTPSPSPSVSPMPSPAVSPTSVVQPTTTTGDVQASTVQAMSQAPGPRAPATIYKDIKIGTTRDEVRNLLGKAVIDDDDGLFYQFTDEMVQIRLDKDKKVRLIAVTYTNNLQNAPKFVDLFGSEAVPSADGAIYNRQQFSEAGYWVSYSKTGGTTPTLTITMQKL